MLCAVQSCGRQDWKQIPRNTAQLSWSPCWADSWIVEVSIKGTVSYEPSSCRNLLLSPSIDKEISAWLALSKRRTVIGGLGWTAKFAAALAGPPSVPS
mmetsp:Transcript_28880/g.60660  ORF Transcript_28880/g.60660 Transcript_28880/m.60660 type:complete len:98 (+) Transcript_28880:52-345(+)